MSILRETAQVVAVWTSAQDKVCLGPGPILFCSKASAISLIPIDCSNVCSFANPIRIPRPPTVQ